VTRHAQGGEVRVGPHGIDQRAQHIVGHIGHQADLVPLQHVAGDLVPGWAWSLGVHGAPFLSHVGRGIAQLWLGDAQASVNDLSFAIDTTPTSGDSVGAWAYRARGLAHASLGQSQAASADYRSYLELSPKAPDRAQVEAWIADLT